MVSLACRVIWSVFCSSRSSRLTFAEIRQAVQGDDATLFVVNPQFERSVRRALLGMVRSNVVKTVGHGCYGDPYRYHLDPLCSAIP